jgi:hypothetical protein
MEEFGPPFAAFDKWSEDIDAMIRSEGWLRRAVRSRVAIREYGGAATVMAITVCGFIDRAMPVTLLQSLDGKSDHQRHLPFASPLHEVERFLTGLCEDAL